LEAGTWQESRGGGASWLGGWKMQVNSNIPDLHVERGAYVEIRGGKCMVLLDKLCRKSKLFRMTRLRRKGGGHEKSFPRVC
jgi:hypothetical protein